MKRKYIVPVTEVISVSDAFGLLAGSVPSHGGGNANSKGNIWNSEADAKPVGNVGSSWTTSAHRSSLWDD